MSVYIYETISANVVNSKYCEKPSSQCSITVVNDGIFFVGSVLHAVNSVLPVVNSV
jgi:hypothetical protein